MVPAMTGLGALCDGPGAGGRRRAAQSVPPLGPWSPGVCVPDCAIKTPSWFSCPGAGTTGFQFVSREPPLLGGGEERKAETISRSGEGSLPGHPCGTLLFPGCVSLRGPSTWASARKPLSPRPFCAQVPVSPSLEPPLPYAGVLPLSPEGAPPRTAFSNPRLSKSGLVPETTGQSTCALLSPRAFQGRSAQASWAHRVSGVGGDFLGTSITSAPFLLGPGTRVKCRVHFERS